VREVSIMRDLLRSLSVAIAIGLLSAAPGAAAEEAKSHRVAIQVDQNDPDVMNLALNNAQNVIEYFNARGEDIAVEIVTYGPGLHMLRADTSPVRDRIKWMVEQMFPAKIAFAACNITKQGMEKREGHAIAILPEATIVPSGMVRLMHLQEQGWSYIRP
jgi:intracellular sulfur oxidation DsrE/DsrF family protein